MEELTTYANWIAMIAGTADGMPHDHTSNSHYCVGYWINHSKKCADDHDSHHCNHYFPENCQQLFLKKEQLCHGH